MTQGAAGVGVGAGVGVTRASDEIMSDDEASIDASVGRLDEDEAVSDEVSERIDIADGEALGEADALSETDTAIDEETISTAEDELNKVNTLEDGRLSGQLLSMPMIEMSSMS